MAVVHQRPPAQTCDQHIGQKRIQIIGHQDIAPDKKQEKEKPELVFGIKRRTFPEKQAHPVCTVATLRQGGGIGITPPDKQHLTTHLLQAVGDLVHPRVCE